MSEDRTKLSPSSKQIYDGVNMVEVMKTVGETFPDLGKAILEILRTPLTRSELERYKKYVASDTDSIPFNQVEYSVLHCKLLQYFNDRDSEKYKTNILIYNMKVPGDVNLARHEIAKLEVKALQMKLSTEDGLTDIMRSRLDKRERRTMKYNRVMVQSNGVKGTVVDYVIMGVKLFEIQHDRNQDAEEEVVTCHPRQDFVPLCDVCDREATSRCANCEISWYCGRVCQREAWAKHKTICNDNKSIHGKKKRATKK